MEHKRPGVNCPGFPHVGPCEYCDPNIRFMIIDQDAEVLHEQTFSNHELLALKDFLSLVESDHGKDLSGTGKMAMTKMLSTLIKIAKEPDDSDWEERTQQDIENCERYMCHD